MKIYISGKIGEEVISDATRRKFAKAEETLRAKGYDVFNPTDKKWEEHLKKQYKTDHMKDGPWLNGTFPDFYGYALLRDLMILSTLDAVLMLDDWKKSPGAQLEQKFAKAVGKRIFYSRYQDAENVLWEEFCSLPEADHLSLSVGCEKAKEYTERHLDEHYIPLV